MHECIGSVLVDSGIFSIIREADQKIWTPQDTGERIGIAVWGRNEGTAVTKLRNMGYTVSKPGFYFVSTSDKEDLKRIETLFTSLQEQGNRFVYVYLHDNSYDRVRISEGWLSDIDRAGEHKLFWCYTEHGDGSYGVYQDSCDVFVGRPPDDEQYEIVLEDESFVLTEPTSFMAIDPCFLDEGVYGTTFTLAPGKYNYFFVRNIETNDKAGLGFRHMP